MSSYLSWCLRRAVTSGNAYAVARHIAKGADVGHVHLGRPLLIWAADRAHSVVIATLLQSKCLPDDRDSLGRTALYVSASRGDVVSASFLLGHGAQVDGCTYRGETPLTAALCYRNLELARMLVRNGASLTRRDYNGRTPLDNAREMLEGSEIIEVLKKDRNSFLKAHRLKK